MCVEAAEDPTETQTHFVVEDLLIRQQSENAMKMEQPLLH